MKKEKRILSILLAYFAIAFFYGIIIKITLWNDLLFSVKTFVPELLIVFVMLRCLISSRMRFQRWMILGMVYYVAVIVVSALFVKSASGALYVFRDFFLPVFAFIVLSNYDFSNAAKKYFMSRFVVLCKIFLILGCLLGILQMINGWEWTSRFYTGYSFYGTDPVSKVFISEFLGRVRAPGLTGNFVTFSYYGLVSCIAIIFAERTSRRKQLFYIMLEAGVLIATLNKTAIAVYGVVLVFYLLKNTRKIIRYLATVLIAMVAMVYLAQNSQADKIFFSLFDRFNIWQNLASYVNWFEILIPVNCLNYNAMAEGFLSFWDNTYFYLLFSQGIIGTVWIYWASYKVYKANGYVHPHMKNFFELLIVFLVASSAFNNITNGRSFFPIYLLLNSIYYTKRIAIHKEEQ